MSASDLLTDRLGPRWRNVWPYAAIAVLAAAFFSPFFFQGKVFLAADTLFYYFPWRAAVPPGFSPHNMLLTDPVNGTYGGVYNDQLHAGHMNQWNPALLAGLPNNETASMSGAPGRFGPLKLLLNRFLPYPSALSLILFLHLLLMGTTMCLYLAEIGAGRRGALFGGVAYMFNGWAMVWLSYESVLASAALLPLILYLLERSVSRRRLLPAFAGALALGVTGLSGSLQYIVYTALLLVLYLAFMVARTALRRGNAGDYAFVLAAFGIVCVGGGLISAISLLPATDIVANSSRINRTFTFQGLFNTLSRVSPRSFVTILFPYFFGSPVHGTNLIPRLPTQEYMNFNELCFYMGVPTVYALFACAVAGRGAYARFYLGLTLLVAAMIAGTAAYYPLFKWWPGLDRTNPSRIIFLLTFVVSAAAGLGIGALEALRGRRRRIFLGGAVALTLGVAALTFWGASEPAILWFNRELFPTGSPQQSFLFTLIAQLRSPSSPVMALPLAFALASVGLLTVAVTLRNRRHAGVALLLLAAVLAGDLIGFGRGYNTLVEPQVIYPPLPSIEFLRQLPKPFRVLLDSRSRLWINSLAPYGIEEVGGYSSVYPERTNALMSRLEYGPNYAQGARFDRWVQFGNLASPLFDLMNARYVLTAPGVTLTLPKLRLIYQGNDLFIYENLQALPRAFVVHGAVVRTGAAEALDYLASPAFDPVREVLLESPPATGHAPTIPPPLATPVTITSYQSDAITVEADLAANGWLVLTNTFYPGWRVEVDGREATLLRGDYLFQTVPLTAGRHRVRFEFRNRAQRRGAWITLAGVLAVLLGGGVIWRRESLAGTPSGTRDDNNATPGRGTGESP